jgi:glycerol-3-phosphate dehydrogenase
LRRDLASFSGRNFDLVVIGGGIAGATIARDAARRGLEVALVDKGDFSGATSAATSRLVHGGLRYLRQLQFGVVRESLKERGVWLAIAPHLVRPLPFLLPLPKDASARATLHAGLALYDAMAAVSGSKLPMRRFIPRDEAERLEPVLAGATAHGALLYHDAQMDSPERLGLGCVLDAAAHGAAAANYVAFERFLAARAGPVEAIAARDAPTGAMLEIRGRMFVNAAGPWADLVLAGTGLDMPPPFAIRRAKGAHIVVRRKLDGRALLLAGDFGHLFMIPWLGRTLIGTTDEPFSGSPDAVRPTRADVEALLARANSALPEAKLSESDVVYAYAGVRPLVVRRREGSTYGMSRAAEIVAHGKSGGPANLWSVIGGKWTTARLVAERALDRIAADAGLKLRSCDTDRAALPEAAPFEKAQVDARLGARLHPDAPYTGGDIARAASSEMALTLEDALLRRTLLAPLGLGSGAALAEAARIMGESLGWSEGRRIEEIAAAKRRIALR